MAKRKKKKKRKLRNYLLGNTDGKWIPKHRRVRKPVAKRPKPLPRDYATLIAAIDSCPSGQRAFLLRKLRIDEQKYYRLREKHAPVAPKIKPVPLPVVTKPRVQESSNGYANAWDEEPTWESMD